MVPVSSSRLCRLSTGDPVLKSPVATSTPNPNSNSNSNPNRHPRAGDSTPKRPVGASMPNRPIQTSNTASPAGSGAVPQRKELKPVTFIRNNNQNNVPVRQPTEQTATSSSVTNGRVAPTVTSLQTFRKTDVKKLQLANSKNIFNNNSNSNSNLNGITCNSNSNSNNPRNNVGNKSGTSGQRQVINPMAARKIVDRPINRTDVNVNNLNRLTPRNGQMS